MRKTLTMVLVVAALAFAGCKKKKTEDTGTASGEVTASGSATGSSMAGSASGGTMAGSGSAIAGSGSGGTMAGSGSGGTMAGSGTTMAGSGSGSGSGSGAVLDATCAGYAAKFAACEKLDPKLKERMTKIFDGLTGNAKAKETCERAAKGWDTTLQKAGC